MRMSKTIPLLGFIFFISTCFTGCSTVMAVKGSDRKDLSVIAIGASRDSVIAELGSPIFSEKTETEYYDIFNFKQGSGKFLAAGKSLLYGTAAVCTIGLSEVIATPLEGSLNNKKVKLKIFYDEKRNVKEIVNMTV